MTYAATVLNQMVMMAIYMLIGYLLGRSGLLTKEGHKGLIALLLYVVLPCVIVNAFLREPTPQTTRDMAVAFAAGAALLGLGILVGRLAFPRNVVDNFSASFSNAGFIGIPLVTAVLGNEYVIYTAGMVALLNVLQWTYGQALLGGKKAMGGAKGLLLNPMVIALLVGVAVYFAHIAPPAPVKGCITALTACNAPLAMIIVGFYLCGQPLKDIFLCRGAYAVSFVRLIAASLLSILLLFWMPWFDAPVKVALVISACAPVGSNVAIYAQRMGQDYKRAVAEVCLSTLFALVTMPLMILLLTALLK